MTPPQIEATRTVADVLAEWPQTISVFTSHQMACVGCPIAPFETVAEVAAIYQLDLRAFLAELTCAAAEPVLEQGQKPGRC